MTLLALTYDTVQQSLAGLSGGSLTPVSFSCGWPGYALKLILTSFGKTRLMPEPDVSCTVVNLSSGIAKSNKSWVLGRVVRDYKNWMPEKVKIAVKENLADALRHDQEHEVQLAVEENRQLRPVPSRKQAGLVISLFRTYTSHSERKPRADWTYHAGLIITAIQFLIAIVLCIIYRDPSSLTILSITVAGTCLAYITGALPQWTDEKWAGRIQLKPKRIALTRGDGAQHVIIVFGEAGELDLEDLANGNAEVRITWPTRIWTVISGLLWAGLSVVVTTIPDNRAWFLLLIGGLGSLQNLIAAQAPRRPENLALYLDMDYKLKVIRHRKVMKALMTLEDEVPEAGASLVDIFFPHGITEDEKKEWAEKKKAF